MNFKRLIICMAAICAASGIYAFDIRDLISEGKDAITNTAKDLLSSDKIGIPDLYGEWKAKGPAVCFKSDNLLQKAGGAAAATYIENKADPYFKKFGLDQAVLNIATDSTFTLKADKMDLKGELNQDKNGNFFFKFKLIGSSGLTVPAYLRKSANSLEVTFDADRLRRLLVAMGSFSGKASLKAAAEFLDKYEGLCIGFDMTRQGKSNQKSTPASGDKKGASNALDKLKEALKHKNK